MRTSQVSRSGVGPRLHPDLIKIKENIMEDKKFTVCIVGGGSRYTPGILKMLVAEQERFPCPRSFCTITNTIARPRWASTAAC